jgi:hypothetical protein
MRLIRKQVPSEPTSVRSIVTSSGFRAGFADARAGRPFNVDGQPDEEQWDYERGHTFARLYPSTALLNSSGRISQRAILLATIAFRDHTLL